MVPITFPAAARAGTFLKVALLCLAATLAMTGRSQAEARKLWEVKLRTGSSNDLHHYLSIDAALVSDRRGGVIVQLGNVYQTQITWIGAAGRIIYQATLPVGYVGGANYDSGIQGVSAHAGLFITSNKRETLNDLPFERLTSTVWRITRDGRQTLVQGVKESRSLTASSNPLLVDEAGFFSFQAEPDGTGLPDAYTVSIRRFLLRR